MRFLLQGTTVVMCGPFHTTDGITPNTGATLSTDEVFLSKNHAAFAAKACTKASSGGARGNYRVFMTTVDSGTLGPLRLDFLDTDAFLHTFEDFMVLPANAYNGIVAGSDYLQVDVIQVNGSAQDTAVSVLTTGDLDAAVSGYSTLSTGDLDAALAEGVDIIKVGGSTQSLTDLKDFADAGYDPANNVVQADIIMVGGAAQTNVSSLGTAELDAAVAGYSTLSTGDLDDALIAIDLDHMANVDFAGASPTSGSLFDLIMNKDTDQTFDQSVESLEALHDGLANSSDLTSNIFDRVVESSETFAGMIREMHSVLCGHSTGGGGSTQKYLSIDTGTTRVKAVCDADGNRNVTLLDGSS